ncbi:hypothetical protein AX15_002661 [Amanita polypyramis BW_CC]|nr:hypothetical protein AX15_002661 [Amanita polypyramis BW_CC]
MSNRVDLLYVTRVTPFSTSAMLGLSRKFPRYTTAPLTRNLAEVVSAKDTSPAPAVKKTGKVATQTLQYGRVPVREDHGLWGFFRRKPGDDLVGEAQYETIEHPGRVEQSRTGRAWKASELRLKSFENLHTLWYLVLRERNLLATQKEEARRMGVSDTTLQVSAERVHQCRKTMARVKAVLNERRLAYEGAMELIEGQREKEEDEVVLQYQREQHEEERKSALSRRELTERRREARLKKEAEAHTAQTEDVVETVSSVNTPEETDAGETTGEMQANQHTSEMVEPIESSSVSTESLETVNGVEQQQKSEKKVKEARRKTPVNAADAAADALFGATAGRRRP